MNVSKVIIHITVIFFFRAIPLAIFQSEPSIKRHYLRKWLKDSSIYDVDIRDVLDWDYYIERLGGTIQKIVTIPAAMQGVPNPVPRVRHPDWLHKKLLEKNDTLKQRRINEMFVKQTKPIEMESESQELQQEPVDIEDIAGNNSPSARTKGRPVVNTTKRKRAASPDEEDISRSWKDVLGPPPPYSTSKEEQQAWIEFQKKKWAYQARQRAARNKRSRNDEESFIVRAGRGEGLVRNPGTGTLGGFLRKAQQTLLNTPWQILQVVEMNQPGVFKLWTLVGNELHQIRLNVPRIFYVNQRIARPEPEPGSECFWRKCNRILPRSHPTFNLYEYVIPESIYLAHSEELQADLSKPDIEGIYESQVPLDFRVFLRVGCVCSVDRQEARRIAAAGTQDGAVTFSLHQLQFRSLAHHPYLKPKPDGSSPIHHIYLYHTKATTGQRAMFGLFLGPAKKGFAFVLDTVKTNNMPNLIKLYETERNEKLKSGKEENELPPVGFAFESRVETDLKQVYRLIQQTLQKYKDEKRGPTLLAIQSVIDLPTLTLAMPALGEFPQVPIHVQGCEEPWDLNWQRSWTRNMIRHYLNSETVLSLSTEQARYFHVPVGNIPSDPTLFAADLFFARHLVKNNFVLWCSSSERPDLGGREADDNRLLAEFEEGSSVVTNNPGCYSTYCVDLDIDGLAVNTLLQSHHVNDVEGTSAGVSFDTIPQASLDEMMGAPGAALPTYDETALCSPAFRVLRSTVGAWLRDVTIHRNVFADFQIQHFYRWLRSPNVLLYDPALKRNLHNLMKKLFMQLVAEFKRLGSVIVYANFNKILINTKKQNIADAVGYIEFVVQSIRNKELFHSIEISYQHCWEYLMWLDPVNHAGVHGKLPKGLTGAGDGSWITSVSQGDSAGELDQNEEEHEDGPSIIMNWNLSEFLPNVGGCRDSFSAIVAGYISNVYLHLTQTEYPETPVRRRVSVNLSQPSSQPTGLGAFANTAEFAKELISGTLGQKLYKATEMIQDRYRKQAKTGEHDHDDSLLPRLANVIPEYKNPALEFVKAICKVLALDPSVKEEVLNVRRNMLRLCRVGEFSDEAEWSDPCTTYVLPEVICKACNHCRDIDLCRDNHRSMENDIPVWKCPLCDTSYDNEEIEYLLMETVKRKSMAFVLQDLQCKKCLQIKMENMSEYCKCTGNFSTLINRNELVQQLRTFRIIAESFNMPILKETTEWTLNMNSSLSTER